MSDSRKDLITKIEAQRKTIREHIVKYNTFKKNGDFTTSATSTISDCQRTIAGLKNKDSSLKNWDDFKKDEDSWSPLR